MAIQAENLGDLIATTQRELGEMKFTEIATDLREFIALSQLMRKNRITFDAGPLIQFDLMVDQNHSARFVGLGATDIVDMPDVMIQGFIPWRHSTHNYAIIRQEVAMNRSPRKIVDLLKTRRLAAMISIAEKMEDRFWRVPAAADDLNPYGVPYWIVKSATAVTTNNGFNGTVPSGYTTVADINPTTYPRWANYAAPYTSVTKDDLVRGLRRALEYTNFKPPVEGIPTFNTGNKYMMYSNYAVVSALEELAEAQNDNLGNDLASKDGTTMLRRVPITAVPKLDEDTTGPVYGINWGEFKTIVLRGEWLRETMLAVQPGQHTVSSTHVDCSFNWIVRNRRRNFVLSTGTGLPA